MTDEPTCKTCRHFREGEAPVQSRMNMAYALAGRWPSSASVAAAIIADRHGVCRFMPEPVATYRTDSCGQHSPSLSPEQST